MTDTKEKPMNNRGKSNLLKINSQQHSSEFEDHESNIKANYPIAVKNAPIFIPRQRTYIVPNN